MFWSGSIHCSSVWTSYAWLTYSLITSIIIHLLSKQKRSAFKSFFIWKIFPSLLLFFFLSLSFPLSPPPSPYYIQELGKLPNLCLRAAASHEPSQQQQHTFAPSMLEFESTGNPLWYMGRGNMGWGRERLDEGGEWEREGLANQICRSFFY